MKKILLIEDDLALISSWSNFGEVKRVMKYCWSKMVMKGIHAIIPKPLTLIITDVMILI